MNEYDEQARSFLRKYGLAVAPDQKGDRCPPWCGENGGECCHGDRYRVTIHRKNDGANYDQIVFDFWNSQHDMQRGTPPTDYDVLACVSGDVNCPEDFEEFCGEYGYDEDSRKAYRQFERASKFAVRLRDFFTADEQAALAEIA